MAEDIVWELLRNRRLGFKFRREHPILQYRIDFYCSEARLALEFDGEQHDPVRDAERDIALANLGVEVLRIPNRSYFKLDIDKISEPLRLILQKCEERTGRLGIAFWE